MSKDEAIKAMIAVISDDAMAGQFQTMGQYRSALIRLGIEILRGNDDQ